METACVCVPKFFYSAYCVRYLFSNKHVLFTHNNKKVKARLLMQIAINIVFFSSNHHKPQKRDTFLNEQVSRALTNRSTYVKVNAAFCVFFSLLSRTWEVLFRCGLWLSLLINKNKIQLAVLGKWVATNIFS